VRQRSGQGLSIPGDPTPPTPAAASSAPIEPSQGSHRFVTAVSGNGRHFVDQHGDPILIKGDSPWSLMTDLSPKQAQLWFDNREQHGFNAAIVSLIGSVANGGPHDDGRTFDGLEPFVDGDVTSWSPAYWSRAHRYVSIAASHGITVLLYPIDGWTIGHSFVPRSQQQCADYGAMVARHFADLENIVWMSGGDYFPRTGNEATGSDVDRCIDAMVSGIRGAGDRRPFSIQLGYPTSISTDNPFWATRVDFNFVYTYYPTYRGTLDAFAVRPALPAVMGEANYEGENNDADTADTTNETLRRQTLWALTSGACGDFRGSDDWEFQSGWESRLDTAAVRQQDRLRRLFETIPWWELEPDSTQPIITAGRGELLREQQEMDVLDNDYATAARTPDGTLGVVYLPTARSFSVDLSVFAPSVSARWVDPASGESSPVQLTDRMSTPGRNSDGNSDWLLIIREP
jgi:hypothetical protein